MTRTPRPVSGNKPMPKVPRESVEYFLAEYDLYAELIEIAAKLKEYFPDLRLRMETFELHETSIPHTRRILRVTAETNLPSTDAIAALKQFDFDWWLEQSDELHALILITIG